MASCPCETHQVREAFLPTLRPPLGLGSAGCGTWGFQGRFRLEAGGQRIPPSIEMVPKVKLKDASGFNKDNWPSMADKAWAAGVHHFYGTTYETP